MNNFITDWLDKCKTSSKVDQSILKLIEENLSGINNEILDEEALLNSLLNISKKEKSDD